MTLENRIQAFVELGHHIRNISPEALESLVLSIQAENPWFTPDNISMALRGISQMLTNESLTRWTSAYTFQSGNPKTVALVMAGNIPLVGFHDFLSVIISGHHAQVKLSSKDSKLHHYLIKHLLWLEPSLQEYITLKEGKLEKFDAVIATGSDNSARYFEQYFGKYPNIIRKNRTSIAILTGEETEADLVQLGVDVFSYFGLGCRNVSKILVPEGYDFSKIFTAWSSYSTIINHHKYCNNYDYQKSILLVNKIPFLDTGFVLLQENEKLVSPVAVLYYEFYSAADALPTLLQKHAEKLQCIVGTIKPAAIPFGQTQFPSVWDYADQVDTLKFLSELR